MIEIKSFIDRKTSREYNNILLEGAEIGSDGEFKISASNAEKANDYLVKVMTGLTQEQVDNLDQKEFDDIVSRINNLRSKKK